MDGGSTPECSQGSRSDFVEQVVDLVTATTEEIGRCTTDRQVKATLLASFNLFADIIKEEARTRKEEGRSQESDEVDHA